MNIFVDLDGVLVNFNKEFEEAFGQSAKQTFAELGDDYTWALIDKIPNFWLDMDPMPDAEVLWNYIKQYNPTVLTKPAESVHNCKKEKIEWVKKYLGEGVEVVFASNKGKYATKDSILIDDKEENIESWEANDGIGILHTSAENTIKQLEKILKGKTAMDTLSTESILNNLILFIINKFLSIEEVIDFILHSGNPSLADTNMVSDNKVRELMKAILDEKYINNLPLQFAEITGFYDLDSSELIEIFITSNFDENTQIDAYSKLANELETKD